MGVFSDDERLAALVRATEELTAPGQPYEVREETVRGERLSVFANRHRSLRDILIGAGELGDGDAFVFGDGERISYRLIERQAASVAAALVDRYGIGPGDRVAICAANCSAWIQLFWAVASLDAVLVAMNGWWTGTEMRNAIELTEPALLVMDTKRHARLEEDPGVPTLIIEDGFASLLDDLDAPLPSTPIDEDDPFMLIFTSGTTGRPKAAVLSHRSVIGYLQLQQFIGARGMHMVGYARSGPGPVRLAPFPLFHVSGLSSNVSTLLGEGPTVWPLGRFDPEQVIELTKREGIAMWLGAEAQMRRLLEHPAVETVDPSQLLSIGAGGAATSPGFIARTGERFPHLKNSISSGYGSTEVGWATIATPEDLRADPATAGRPPLHTRVELLDEHDRPVAQGQTGRIFVGSELTFDGYTGGGDKARVGELVSTGDTGFFDGAGRLHVVGRDDEMIVSGGENVFPREVEDCIAEHPDVVEVAVIGVPDDEFGQRLKAFVVLGADATLDEAAVKALVKATLAGYKVPRDVVFLDELPRNPTGKVLKRELT